MTWFERATEILLDRLEAMPEEAPDRRVVPFVILGVDLRLVLTKNRARFGGENYLLSESAAVWSESNSVEAKKLIRESEGDSSRRARRLEIIRDALDRFLFESPPRIRKSYPEDGVPA